MFLKGGKWFTPPGCNPLREDGRKPIVRVVSGDTWSLEAKADAPDGSPATPANSSVEFVLAENQFSPPMWTGTWLSGIEPYRNRPGYVRISIPHQFTRTVRRGSYMFSLRVSDRMRSTYGTQLAGNFLVEYMPTSDQHSIPYRDGTSEIFTCGQGSGDVTPAPTEDASLAALRSALEAKGVDVPEGATLADMPRLVEAIPSAHPVQGRYIRLGVGPIDILDCREPMLMDFSTLVSYSNLFQGCLAKQIVLPPSLPLDLAASADNLFAGCVNLEHMELPEGFGRNVTACNGMFGSCVSMQSLELPEGFGRNVTSCKSMFYNMSALKDMVLPPGFASGAGVPVDTGDMFISCISLQSVTFSSGFTMGGSTSPFSRCTSLKAVRFPVKGTVIISENSANVSRNMFLTTPNLEEISGNFETSQSMYLGGCTLLTRESLLNVIRCLAPVSGDNAPVLALGATNLAKLTDDEKSAATDKGWMLA